MTRSIHFSNMQTQSVNLPSQSDRPPPAPLRLPQSRSSTGDCLWGYPFSGPRTSILFSSKRSRRQRALLDLLQVWSVEGI